METMETIPIKGTVIPDDYKDVYDFWNLQSVTPQDVEQALKDAGGKDVTLEINSPGGYVDVGSEIYTALKGYSGKVTANIVGQAASAASWIALAADKVMMSPTATMFVHKAIGGGEGNSDDLASVVQGLNETDKAFVDLYAKKSGKSPEDVYQLMQQSTTMNAKTAVQNGFADGIMFENEAEPALNAGALPLTTNMITKTKNLIHAKAKAKTDDVAKPIQNKKAENKGQVKKDLSLLLWK